MNKPTCPTLPEATAAMRRRLSKDEINALPLERWQGPIQLVNSPQQCREVLPRLSSSSLLGFDTETRPAFRKGQSYPPSLLQLATAEEVFLFQLKKTGLPQELSALLSDHTVAKVGVAIADDLENLQKIESFQHGGFTDIARISKRLGLHHHGLRGLAAAVLDFRISKSARTSNWANDQLSQAQLQYAATDAWVGREIFIRLSELQAAA
ncbi:3'-5' exonuclease [Desulfogranum mediterraneum]|uniref:3'-5' exonuclease n=1 Tax=Desulfogranum mediterraneum TaxID=160661 RepID=UPI000415754C|nr:3'-5' exonuclease [Desulfogranum mediterraneum]